MGDLPVEGAGLLDLRGHLGDGEPPEAWGADGLIDSPLDLLGFLRSA